MLDLGLLPFPPSVPQAPGIPEQRVCLHFLYLHNISISRVSHLLHASRLLHLHDLLSEHLPEQVGSEEPPSQRAVRLEYLMCGADCGGGGSSMLQRVAALAHMKRLRRRTRWRRPFQLFTYGNRWKSNLRYSSLKA